MRDTFAWERNMQPFADAFYRRMGVKTIDRGVSGKQYDLIVNGKTVEEKFLFSGTEYSNMLVELVQDVRSGGLGWFYHCTAEKLAWYYCPASHIDPPMSVYLIDYPMLKQHVIGLLSDENTTWRKFQICNQHYGITLNLPVLWSELKDKKIALYYSMEAE